MKWYNLCRISFGNLGGVIMEYTQTIEKNKRGYELRVAKDEDGNILEWAVFSESDRRVLADKQEIRFIDENPRYVQNFRRNGKDDSAFKIVDLEEQEFLPGTYTDIQKLKPGFIGLECREPETQEK